MAARATHLAAVLARPRRFELAPVARPEPGPGEALVRVEGCGVCGSNLPPWQGRDWFRYPFAPGAPGHEGFGRVLALGPGAAAGDLAEGDRVALLTSASFAAHEVAPLERLVKLPAALEGPFPGEAVGCAVSVFAKSRVRPGDTVAVIGAGFLGLVVIRLAARAGGRVIALSRRETSLAWARRMGAAEAIATEGRDGAAAVSALTGGRGADVVVEAVGLQGALDLATRAVREGGRLVIAGFHQDGTRTVDLCSWNWRALELVNAHERDLGAQRAAVQEGARLAADGALDVAPLCRTFPLREVGAAFDALESRPDGFVKAVVAP